ncbi:hypothetical protein [Dyadobacter psychrotolerans]|uniref:YopA central domain-containing protein n=1 Tax=Dyadobacter psychrotolerans TaxID=2541721 RepID=A0A4R5DV52_9BACT|nr:hypothetical protein [Dyadobacter psychrotolerans]TDE18402.1 hypothetical protein E0F88_02360 [Dyadobacter psychrotolerans]
MDKEIEKIHREIPDAIDGINVMEEANSIIIIYQGEYFLKNKIAEIKLLGKITYEWFANSGVYFYGNPVSDNGNLYKTIDRHEDYSIIIQDLEFGNGFITNFTLENLSFITIKGAISKHAILGDKSISASKLKFSIPNLRDFFGLPVKRIRDSGISTSMGRIILEDDVYTIIIDKCPDFKNRKESLQEKGGYITLYDGELTSKKKSISYVDTEELFYCLDTFLTFLNGRRTASLFIHGIFEERVIWTDFTDKFIDSYKSVKSWPGRHSIKGFNELWKRFRSFWSKPDDKNFLTSLIHWYVEANSHTGFSEGSIILAQTALELVYNWWIVEKRKMILGRDAENISASNKIRLLISQLNISSEIPIDFTELTNFKNSTENVIDAPDAIVYIRNAIVHSQEEKRKKLNNITNTARYQALQIYIRYIEISLLHILDYKGDHVDRCSKSKY